MDEDEGGKKESWERTREGRKNPGKGRGREERILGRNELITSISLQVNLIAQI